MKMPLFTGCASAIVTPFGNAGPDLGALGNLLDFQLENGVDAIVVCGTTGEASTMSSGELSAVIGHCVRHVAGRVPVIAGAGSNNTATAAERCRIAQDLGADGLLVVTPYYNKASQTGLIRHFETIADAVEKPVVLYNVPSRTGVAIAPETYAVLAKHPNINGVKEASGNLGALQRTFAHCPEDFTVWSGNDGDTVAVCALGGKGVVSVVSNVLPAEMRRLTRLCLQNDFAAAGKLQVELSELCGALFCDVNPIPVKTALNLLGWNAGELRLPLCPPGPEKLERIRSALLHYGLPVVG